jgi:hypothetical protein
MPLSNSYGLSVYYVDRPNSLVGRICLQTRHCSFTTNWRVSKPRENRPTCYRVAHISMSFPRKRESSLAHIPSFSWNGLSIDPTLKGGAPHESSSKPKSDSAIQLHLIVVGGRPRLPTLVLPTFVLPTSALVHEGVHQPRNSLVGRICLQTRHCSFTTNWRVSKPRENRPTSRRWIPAFAGMTGRTGLT